MSFHLLGGTDVRSDGRKYKSMRLLTTAILVCCSLLEARALLVGQDFKFTGVANFRDIGGYSAGSGHKIKSGVVFRSGELSGLTAADQQALSNLKIRYEIDLRTDAERAANPTKWGTNVPQVIAISVMPNDG